MQYGELSPAEACQQLTPPNQTGIGLDNRKIMWWKMDTQIKAEKPRQLYLEAASFPRLQSHPSKRSEDDVISPKAHPQRSMGTVETEGLFSYNFLCVLISGHTSFCHHCVFSFALASGLPMPQGEEEDGACASRSRGRRLSGSLQQVLSVPDSMTAMLLTFLPASLLTRRGRETNKQKPTKQIKPLGFLGNQSRNEYPRE